MDCPAAVSTPVQSNPPISKIPNNHFCVSILFPLSSPSKSLPCFVHFNFGSLDKQNRVESSIFETKVKINLLTSSRVY
jgi:hypothetical protein